VQLVHNNNNNQFTTPQTLLIGKENPLGGFYGQENCNSFYSERHRPIT